MRKRIISLLASTVLVLSLLSGCGNADTETGNTTESVQQETTPAKSEATTPSTDAGTPATPEGNTPDAPAQVLPLSLILLTPCTILVGAVDFVHFIGKGVVVILYNKGWHYHQIPLF